MKKYLRSAYIKKKDVPEETNLVIEKDLALFNKMRRKVFAGACRGKDYPHTELKKAMQCSDYFVTALEGAVKMTLSSQKELLSDYIDDGKQDISDMGQKADGLAKRLEGLLKMKQGIINYTKDGYRDRSLLCNFKSSGVSFCQDGTVRISSKKHAAVYENIFAFEHEWLDPKIKLAQKAEKNLGQALCRKKNRLGKMERQKENGRFSVYFGSRKLMHDTKMPDEQRGKLICKKREGSMTLSGRYDAADGNFMVHYDPESHHLSYRGSRTEKGFLDVGTVIFPRKDADGLIRKAFQEESPKAWTVTDFGNAWRFDICLTLPDDGRQNGYYEDGCIGIDINTGHFGVVETDKCGNPTNKETVRFPMEGKSSEQNKQAVSAALDEVFRMAARANKPIAAENIGATKRKAGRYSNEHKKNRGVSTFPSSTIRQLLESKSYKYSIAVTFVNPAYTSQAGKIKYMARYGMNIHESAALAVARRGMGFAERLPDPLRPCLEPKEKPRRKDSAEPNKASPQKEKPKVRQPRQPRKPLPPAMQRRIIHWKKAYPMTKQIPPHEIYEQQRAKKRQAWSLAHQTGSGCPYL